LLQGCGHASDSSRLAPRTAVDPRQAIEAAGLLPRGKLVVLEGCGHAPQIEQADVINRLVLEFLQDAA
jgi:pimeloyl-ACP methyl ester carboxylesterase